MDRGQRYIGKIDQGLWAPLSQALSDLPRAVVEQTVDRLQSEGLLERTEAPESDHLAVHRAIVHGDRYYAIHDDELLALKETGALVSVLLGGALATKGLSVAAGFAVLVYKYFKNRVRLTADQALVLWALKEEKPDGMELVDVALAADLTGDTALAALESMRDIRKANGETTPLVDEEDGRWFAVNV